MRWRGFYIAKTGMRVPDHRVSLGAGMTSHRYDSEEARRTQMVEYGRAEPEESSLEYAAEAGRAILADTPSHLTEKLRAVYYTFVGPPGGPPAWNAASKVHELLGLGPRVLPVGLTNGCAMGLGAVQMACLHLNGDPGEQPGSALVLGAEVWPRKLVDPLTATRGLILADGGAGVLISNEIGGVAVILSTSVETDSSLADATRGTESLAHDPDAVVNLAERMTYFLEHTMESATMRAKRDERIRAVVGEALTDAGLTLDQIDAFVLTHSGARSLERGYFRLFPRAAKVTNTKEIGLRTGHVGTADWFIGLHTLRARNKLKSGDHVLMLGGAGGWTEAAVVLRMV